MQSNKEQLEIMDNIKAKQEALRLLQASFVALGHGTVSCDAMRLYGELKDTINRDMEQQEARLY